MRIGSLGDVVFSINSRKIETLTGLKESASAAFSEHKRHNNSSILEFTGRNAKEISFSMTLSTELGVNVENEIKKIDNYLQKGTSLRLILGKRVYGSYKWVITKYSVSHKYFDKRGAPVVTDVSITLKEYCK